MKRVILTVFAAIMLFSLAACARQVTVTEQTSEPEITAEQTSEQTPEPETTPEQTAQQTPEQTAKQIYEPQSDWAYDEATKTLYLNKDMGKFSPDTEGYDGTRSDAPWADYLPEIENIVVGDDVTYIGDYAFAFCSNLKNVTVSSNVSDLNSSCFFKSGDFRNGSYMDMYFYSTPSFGDDVFGYTWDNPNVVIHVPDDAKEYWASYILQKGRLNLEGYDLQRTFEKDDAVYTMLTNPQGLWGEGSESFAENDGGEFGGGVKKAYNAEMQRLEVFGEDTGACMKFNTSLMTCMSDVGIQKVPQQAVIIQFSASDITEARISFDALDEIDFSFRDDGIYFVDVANYMEMPIRDYMPNSLELKNDTIYYFFFAFNAEGNIRMLVWEDGFVKNHAYFEYDLYQDVDDINNCDLILHLAIGQNEQLNIYRYWIYTFDSFLNTPYFILESAGKN